MPDLLQAVADARRHYFTAGNEVTETSSGVLVRNRDFPTVRDANFIAVSAGGASEVLAWAEGAFSDSPHQAFKLDPFSHPSLEATLIAWQYVGGIDLLELVLEGSLQAGRAEVPIRPVATEADWSSLRRLALRNYEGQTDTSGRPVVTVDLGEALFGAKRAKAPAVQYFLAEADGVDVAFVSSFADPGGVGIVEDLFTLPGHRHRGIATALIGAAIDHARERGAGPILIGADPADTPKAMYRALGFEPICVQRAYWRARDTGSPSQ